MEVILLERIEKLGQMGDVVTVKPGYARNFLLPQKKALPATDGNKSEFDQRRAQLETENLARKGDADAVAGKMVDVFVTMVRQAGEAGQLYGSVNARDVAKGLTEAGFTVSRSQVRLPEPIKSVGLHPVHVSLHPEVSVTITANIARSLDEAKIQERTGEAVSASDDGEDDQADFTDAADDMPSYDAESLEFAPEEVENTDTADDLPVDEQNAAEESEEPKPE
jgi:large subunit ribosomal protein L9